MWFSLNFIRLLRFVITPSVTEGVITTRSNRMKFRLDVVGQGSFGAVFMVFDSNG